MAGMQQRFSDAEIEGPLGDLVRRHGGSLDDAYQEAHEIMEGCAKERGRQKWNAVCRRLQDRMEVEG